MDIEKSAEDKWSFGIPADTNVQDSEPDGDADDPGRAVPNENGRLCWACNGYGGRFGTCVECKGVGLLPKSALEPMQGDEDDSEETANECAHTLVAEYETSLTSSASAKSEEKSEACECWFNPETGYMEYCQKHEAFYRRNLSAPAVPAQGDGELLAQQQWIDEALRAAGMNVASQNFEHRFYKLASFALAERAAPQERIRELESLLTSMTKDDAFAELCACIGEEPDWLTQARAALRTYADAKGEGNATT